MPHPKSRCPLVNRFWPR